MFAQRSTLLVSIISIVSFFAYTAAVYFGFQIGKLHSGRLMSLLFGVTGAVMTEATIFAHKEAWIQAGASDAYTITTIEGIIMLEFSVVALTALSACIGALT